MDGGIEQNPAYGTAQPFTLQDIHPPLLAVYALVTPRFTPTSLKKRRLGGSAWQCDEGPDKDHGSLKDDLRDTMIEHLHSQVEVWREGSRHKDNISAGLFVRLPPQIESPRELPGAPETPAAPKEKLAPTTKTLRRALSVPGGLASSPDRAAPTNPASSRAFARSREARRV